MSQLQGVAPSRKALVINNCLPERRSEDAADAPATDSERFNIVFLGRLRPSKGVDHLIEVALRILREGIRADFFLAGEFEWKNSFAAALLQRVKDEGCESHIHFLGDIQDVFGLLRQCDLHVHPALAEAFGNVILEAKYCSVPSVVYGYGEPPNIVRHCVDGYVCRERSADALYEGIRYFLDDLEKTRMAGKAASDSLERFSVTRASDAWAELYRNIH